MLSSLVERNLSYGRAPQKNNIPFRNLEQEEPIHILNSSLTGTP
jgi:hypothetical protein